MNDTLFLRFLYRTVPGRFLLGILVNPVISKIGGFFLSLRISKIAIPGFIKKNNISMEGIEVPSGGFASFNDFFKRSKSNFVIDAMDDEVVAPCDGLLSIVKIDGDTIFNVKNTEYEIRRLLDDKSAKKKYKNGVAFIYRLTPAHYHRYSYSASGMVVANRCIKGVLHCVRPVALCNRPVFIENAREYQEIKLENGSSYIQMEVGALMVGKISNHHKYKVGSKVKIGREKGCFEFGGSTIICIYEEGAIKFDEAFSKETTEEMPVNIGNRIGKIVK